MMRFAAGLLCVALSLSACAQDGPPSVAAKPRVTAIATHEYPVPARRPHNSVMSGDRLAALGIHLPAWQTALALCQA